MKVSIIIPVLNSHEVVRRQILHWRKIGLPDDVEILVMDDGSDPPLEFDTSGLPVSIHPTNEFRPFTSSVARNTAARQYARGEYLLMLDVDYIISRQLVDQCRECVHDKLTLSREFGILDEQGNFTQDHQALLAYGLTPGRLANTGVRIKPHPNVYLMRREVFLATGGYREDYVFKRGYPQGEDNLFKKTWLLYQRAHNATVSPLRPVVYMFPNGQFCGDVDYNPFGLFHGLSRKTGHNYLWKKQIAKGGQL